MLALGGQEVDLVADRAEPLDGALDHVAVVEPFRRLEPQADPLRRPHEDEVAGHERGAVAEELDGSPDVEHHVGGV